MSNLTCQNCNSTFSNLGNLNKHKATNKKCNSIIPNIPESIPNNGIYGIGGMMNLLLEIKSIVSNKEENNMIRLLKEEIRMMKEKEKDEIKGLKKEIQLLKEAHAIEIKTLKAKFQEPKKEVKEERKEERKEEKKEEKEDLSMFEIRADGFTHIGNLSVSRMKAIKDNFLKTGKAVLPEKDFKNTPENMDRVKLYLGIPIKKKQEEKKEEPKPEPQPKEEDEEDEDETDEDKAFCEYCDKDEYGVYHIGGIQSDSLTRLKDFYINRIPKDLLFGERKTKCADKMDYLKREFASKFSNDFSGSKDDYNKLKFYLEN